jgi:hypothetical protein
MFYNIGPRLSRLSIVRPVVEIGSKIWKNRRNFDIYLTSLMLGIWADHQLAMERCALKNVNSCLNTNIDSYLETSSGQSFNLYLNVVHIFNTSVN